MISVIIPSFNRATMLVRCIKALLASNDADFEIVAIDDCSSEDVRGVLSESKVLDDPRVRLLRNETNLQLGRSRARGADAAKGDLLLFLDDDNLVEPDMLALMAKEFATNPRLGLLAPMAIHVNGPKDGRIWTLGSDFNRLTSSPSDFAAGLPLAELPRDRTLFPTLYSPNAFMVHKETYTQVGGFDFDLPFYYDDADFGWRIAKLGYENRILSTARTYHQNFMTSSDAMELRQLGINAPWKAYRLARNRFRFVRKHFPLPNMLLVFFVFAPLSAVFYCAKALSNRRPDIAFAYLRGTFAGLLMF